MDYYEKWAKKHLDGKRMKLTKKDCEIVIKIMLDLLTGKLDRKLTREISNKYGLSMKKTLYVMKEFYGSHFVNDEGMALDLQSNDGEDGFAKHCWIGFYDDVDLGDAEHE